jgi:hypothetical protein
LLLKRKAVVFHNFDWNVGGFMLTTRVCLATCAISSVSLAAGELRSHRRPPQNGSELNLSFFLNLVHLIESPVVVAPNSFVLMNAFKTYLGVRTARCRAFSGELGRRRRLRYGSVLALLPYSPFSSSLASLL